LQIVLPVRKFDKDRALQILRWIQVRNHRAAVCHRKKMTAQLRGP
jgi:hypothetical protein